jgi:phage-related protein
MPRICIYLHINATIDIMHTVKFKSLRAPPMKPLEFLGSSRDDLVEMPAGVRHEIGVESMRVQFGGQPTDFKTMSSVGADV